MDGCGDVIEAESISEKWCLGLSC